MVRGKLKKKLKREKNTKKQPVCSVPSAGSYSYNIWNHKSGYFISGKLICAGKDLCSSGDFCTCHYAGNDFRRARYVFLHDRGICFLCNYVFPDNQGLYGCFSYTDTCNVDCYWRGAAIT